MNQSVREAFGLLPRLSGAACAVECLGHPAGYRHQSAAGHRRGAEPTPARTVAGVRQHGPDHTGPGAAGAVLSPAAGAVAADPASVRLRRARFGFPAGAAGADALFHAAGVAKHGDGADGNRSGHHHGGTRRGHDAAPVPVAGGIAAGCARHHGGHPHRDGAGGGHRDSFHACRPDQPGQLHLHGAADRELGLCIVRLRQRGVAGAGAGPAPGAGGQRTFAPRARAAGLGGRGTCRRDRSQPRARLREPAGAGAGDRGQEFRRAIYPGRCDL